MTRFFGFFSVLSQKLFVTVIADEILTCFEMKDQAAAAGILSGLHLHRMVVKEDHVNEIEEEVGEDRAFNSAGQ